MAPVKTTTIFAALTCTLVLLLLQVLWRSRHYGRSEGLPAMLTSDVQSPIWNIGTIPSVAMYFEESTHYGLDGSDADAEWAALLPVDDGIVRVGPEREPYMLSMFHQLRCLDILRRSYVSREGGPNSDLDSRASSCLNYIRQTILCRRDLRLEPVVNPNGSHTVQPWGAMTCADWRKVYEAAARH